MKKILTLLSFVFLCFAGIAQVKVGLPISAPHTSALLDLSNLEGSPKGFLLPTLTTIQRDLITLPAAGLEIYNSDINLMQYWNGTEWVTQNGGGSASSEATIDAVTIQQYGVYQVGTPTTNANYITVTVNVTTTGSWSAQTSKKNGVSFKGGGVFTTLGTNTVKLYALTNAIPTINGKTLYSMVMGKHDEDFLIDYNSKNLCLTPSPAIGITALCAIKVLGINVFSITGGTVNSNAITYSIYPATGIDNPTGLIISGNTPAIIFSIPGKYTITYKATNTDYTGNCNQSSISASQSFSVVSGSLSTTPVAFCNTGRFGPGSFDAGRTLTSLVDGVSVKTTWSGTVNNSTYLYASCGFDAAPSPNFNINSGAGNTFTFSNPVSNIQLITGFDNTDKITITAKNGATDVTDQLVISKLTPACATNNYSQASCNSFTALGTAGTALGLNIGGVYYTSLTITVNNNDCQFDLSYCNAKSIGCLPPAAFVISSTSNPAILPSPVAAGNTITFTAAGGSPKTSDITWVLSSIPSGMISGPTTGTGVTALATLAGTNTGEIDVVYTVTNAASGGCFPTTISGNQSFKVVSGTPAVSTIFCSSFIGPNELPNINSTTNQTIGANSVKITRSGNAATSTYTQNITTCGTPFTGSPSFGGTSGAYTFSFDKDVSNLQIVSAMDVKDDKHTYKIYKNGIDISSQLVLTQLGTCPTNSIILNNTITLNTSGNSNVAVSLGGVYFDRLDVLYSGPGGDSQFLLGLCQGSSVDACLKPDAFTITNFRTPAIFPKPITAGNSITFIAAGGTPNTSGVSWIITSIPEGLLSGATAGTGNVATAILTANANGSVTVQFTANNLAGNCNLTPVKGSQSTFVTSGVPSPSLVFCTNFIGTNELTSNTSTTEQTIGVNKVIISRLGSNVNSAFSQTYASCGTPMNSNACFEGSMGVNTFTFSNDVSNLQVLSGMSRVNDMMTFTIFKNNIDISNQLVVTKLGSCTRNINSPVNNTIQLNVSTLNNVVVNLGGIYFDRLDITYSSSGNASPSNPFQLGLCNAVSLLTCATPSAITITTATSPAVLPYPVAAGNAVNFTATGGLPNTGISWVLSSVPAGLLSGLTEGVGNIAKAILIAGASGDITATYTYSNSGLGDCNPRSIVATQSVYITPFCSDFIDFYNLAGQPTQNSVTTQQIGQNMVTISRTGYQDDYRRSQNNNTCGTPMTSDGSFKTKDGGTAEFSFSKSVSNIQVLTAMATQGNTMIFRIYKNGVEVTDRLVLSKLGKCADITSFPTNSSVRLERNTSGNVAVVLGGIFYDKLTIDYRADITFGGGYAAFQLGLCTGSSTEIIPCYNPTPSAIGLTSSTSPAILPNVIQDGNLINFEASGGQPRVGNITYALTSIPATGILTGVTTGSGYFATARLLANAKGTVTATYTATNTDGSCTPSTTTATKTINVAVDCPSPDAITITNSTNPSPLPYIINQGNTINFSATGGTPNNGGLQWTLTSEPDGLITSTTSGTGNNASAVLVANAAGKIIVRFNSTYASSGNCVPIPVSATNSVTLSSLCTSSIGTGELPTNTSVSTQTIGNNQVVITRTGNPDNVQSLASSNGCNIPFTSDMCFKGTPGIAYTFNFDYNVKDIQLHTAMNVANDKLTIKLYKRGLDVTNQSIITQLGTCPGNVGTSGGSSGNERIITLMQNTPDNVAVNLGNVYFDRIDILYSGNGGSAPFRLGLCQATSFPNCIVPSGLQITNTTTPATLPYLIEAGNSINFTAGGSTSNTSMSWVMNSVPVGLLLGSLSGTGTNAQAILAKNATGAITVTYTVNNDPGTCEPASATFSKTVNLSSFCSDFIGYNILNGTPSVNSTSTQTIGSQSVLITRSGYQNDYLYSQNKPACGTPMIRETSFKASSAGTAVFEFSKYVTNIQILTALNVTNAIMTISIYKDGADISSQLVLTDMGLCRQNFTNPTNNSIKALNSNNGNVAVNMGGAYFNKIAINYKTDDTYSNTITAYQLGLCHGLASIEDVPIPPPTPTCKSKPPSALVVTSYTTPLLLPHVIKGGNSITFNATGGTPNQGAVTWTLVTTNGTNPGIITTTTGTGFTCTATFEENFFGKAVVSFSSTNTTNGCSATTTIGTQSKNIPDGWNGPDPLRARLTVSTAAYDAANINQWVQVTPDEYSEVYQYIPKSSRYGSFKNYLTTPQCNEACASESYMGYYTAAIEQTPAVFEYQPDIPADIYVYGFSFRTPDGNNGAKTNGTKAMSLGRRALIGADYPIPGQPTYLPDIQLLPGTRYCFILKKTDSKILKNEKFSITMGIGGVLSIATLAAFVTATDYGYWYWYNAYTPIQYPPKENSHNVQIIGTTIKNW